MNIRKLFGEMFGSNELVVCSEKKERKWITAWLKSHGWEWKDFPHLLKSIDISLPIQLSYNFEKSSYMCKMPNNNEVEIKLGDKCLLKHECWEIWVCYEKEIKKYIIDGKREKQKEIKVFLMEKRIEQANKQIDIYHFGGENRYRVTFANKNILEITIANVAIEQRNLLQKKRDTFEEYLLNYTQPVDIEKLYHDIVSILELSQANLISVGEFYIEYWKQTTEEIQILAFILEEYGVRKSCAVTEEEKTYFLFEKEEWECKTKLFNLRYIPEEKMYNLEVKANIQELEELCVKQTLPAIESKVMEIRKRFWKDNC